MEAMEKMELNSYTCVNPAIHQSANSPLNVREQILKLDQGREAVREKQQKTKHCEKSHWKCNV